MNIKGIAHRAGVSSTTISRVLSNSGYVGEETRQKALRTVNEYNYVPSTIARSLSIQDSLSVGIITPDIEDEFFSKIMSGISEMARSYHYNTVFLGINKTSGKEYDFLKIMESQRLEGVIVTSVSETDTVIRDYLLRLEESGILVVLVDRNVRGAQLDGTLVGNQWSSYDGVVTLMKAGHERITVITSPETSRPSKDRCQGYLQTMEDSGLSVPEKYVACGDLKIVKAYECTERLLGLKGPPTAIFTSSNLSTLGCLRYLMEYRIKVGRNVSLIGFDGTDALRMIDCRTSVVDRDVREQGGEAMRLPQKCSEDFGKSRQRRKRIITPYRVILRGPEHKKTA